MIKPLAKQMANACSRLLISHYAWCLIASALLLMCTDTLSVAPMLVMSAIGIYRVMRHPAVLYEDPACRLVLLLFLCLWLPQLISLFDAVNIEHSLKTVTSRSLYLFCGIFIVQELMRGDNLRGVSVAFFLIAFFWCIDALIQYGTGTNLLGYPAVEASLSGMFYPKIRLGLILAVLAPVLLEVFRSSYRDKLFPWLILIPFVLVIFLSGRRSAWIMLVIGLLAYIPIIFHTLTRRAKHTLLASACLAAAAVTYVSLHDESIQYRITTLSGIFAGGTQTGLATSRRVPLWDTGYEMFKRNWFNGVGPRGFRHVYHEYAAADNYFMQHGREGSTHPHLFILEVAAETGVMGVAGFMLFYWAALRLWWRGRHDTKVVAWTASLLAAMFPFNAHMALYGSYWSGFMWLLLACSIAVIAQGKGGIRSSG